MKVAIGNGGVQAGQEMEPRESKRGCKNKRMPERICLGKGGRRRLRSKRVHEVKMVERTNI